MDSSKRFFLIQASTFISSLQLFPVPLVAASNDDCTAIDRLIANANDQATSSYTWAATSEYNSVASIKNKIDNLKTEISSTSKNMNKLQIDRILSGISFFGSSVFLTLGVLAATSTVTFSTGTLIIGSIVFSGGMILAKLFTIPQDTKLVDILVNKSNTSIGTILSSMGDNVYALSSSTAKFSRNAAPIVSSIFLSYEINDLIKKKNKYSELDQKLKKLQVELDRSSKILNNITASQILELRHACSQAVAETMEREKARSCFASNFML